MGPGEKLDEKYGTLGLAHVHPQTIQVRSASKAVVVRASDMKLRLKDGRLIDTSPPSAALVIATRAANAPIVASVLGPLGFLAEAADSSESDKQRQLLINTVKRSLFGERVLREDKGKDGGMVLFRLPPGASADEATVIVWGVEPATAAGSQVEVPLLGAVPTR